VKRDTAGVRTLETLEPILRRLLEVLGEDPDREGLRETPRRWARALLGYTEGLWHDPGEHLAVRFGFAGEDSFADYSGMIVVDNIEFTSTCEHHMAPFSGVVHIGYIPNGDRNVVVGLSKLSRVVRIFASRLQIQERMTEEIAEAIFSNLHPAGVIVVVRAVHYCMVQRGVEQRSSSALTTARRGVFLTDPNLEIKFQNYLLVRGTSGNHGLSEQRNSLMEPDHQ